MKTMTCAQMGGPCDTALTAASEQEMMQTGWKHLEEAHPDTFAETSALPKEAMDAWAADFHTKWEATPEDAEAEAAAAV